MNALIVYESMFGNTRTLAEAIADALASAGVRTTVVAAADAPTDPARYDLVVVGAPTHGHTLPQTSSREEAAVWSADPARGLTLQDDFDRPGVREWLERLKPTRSGTGFATFATRAAIPRIFSGDAASVIARRLKHQHLAVVAHEAFTVDLKNRLVPGEEQRSRDWAVTMVPVLENAAPDAP